MRVNGILNGIKDSYIEVLERLYDMDTAAEEIIDNEMLDIIVKMTDLLNKEISVFINRRGKVLDVSVGDYHTVELPSFDFRRGAKRLSGVRCIHTHPQGSGCLSSVDLSALINMRLDCVVAVGVEKGSISNMYVGHLVPDSGVLSEQHKISGPYNKDEMHKINIIDTIKWIEKEISTDVSESTGEGRKERVLLVGVSLQGQDSITEDLLEELGELAKAADAEVVSKTIQKRNKIDNTYYIGRGKAVELGIISQAYDIDTIIFDDELSGAQVRNLEEITNTKIIDRTTLILDIFAKRAQTKEGKLQVELAQLKYRLPRLIGLGKVLSRTGGGIGTRGPGEKKLEIDRRHIRERIEDLERALEEVRKNRGVQREKRRSSRIPIVSLVGYTNSGKSTLRNYLSRKYAADTSTNKEDVLEANMLFATLDPTTRIIKLPGGRSVLVSDTVGFIRKLPHDLVEAFKSTLEEVIYSDALIHVIDSSAQNAKEQINAVNEVLKELNVLDKPTITVLNKIDKVNNKDGLNAIRRCLSNDVVEISALYGNGIDGLVAMLENRLFNAIKTVRIRVPYDKMGLKSNLYNDCRIISEEYNEDGVIITAEVDDDMYKKYRQYIILDMLNSNCAGRNYN